MTSPPSAPEPGPWVQQWLSIPRHAVYLAAADNAERALALYEWNAQLSAALRRDLAHLEIGLRNAYDQALTTRWPGPPHWTRAGDTVFAPLYRRRGNHQVDVNRQPRASIQQALRAAGGADAPAGKVIAELPFGFWRYLSPAQPRMRRRSGWRACTERFPPVPIAATSTIRSAGYISSATASPTMNHYCVPTWPSDSTTWSGWHT